MKVGPEVQFISFSETSQSCYFLRGTQPRRWQYLNDLEQSVRYSATALDARARAPSSFPPSVPEWKDLDPRDDVRPRPSPALNGAGADRPASRPT